MSKLVKTSPVDSGDMLIDSVADWLMAQALSEVEVAEVFGGCCERLLAADVPLFRAMLGHRTLHPLFKAVTHVWSRREGLVREDHPHGDDSPRFTASPMFHMFQHRLTLLRRRLTGPDATLDFPILEELRQTGATDYLAYMVPFGRVEKEMQRTDGIMGSWTTDRTSGFSDADLRALRRIERRLAVACKVSIKEQIARNVITTYLGPDAGERVLDGTIKRGDGQTVHAAIWFSDLRGSTRMAESMPRDEFLEVLNDFFECTAGTVLEHGGEVLRFIGDASLAIFPMHPHQVEDPRECPVHRSTCATALAAARESASRMQRLNDGRAEQDLAALEFGVGLHVGDVMYGNIGVPARLEFSVIGSAANQAARIEGLCKHLGHSLVVSKQFSELVPERWVSLGAHELPGLPRAEEVFTLAETHATRATTQRETRSA